MEKKETNRNPHTPHPPAHCVRANTPHLSVHVCTYLLSHPLPTPLIQTDANTPHTHRHAGFGRIFRICAPSTSARFICGANSKEVAKAHNQITHRALVNIRKSHSVLLQRGVAVCCCNVFWCSARHIKVVLQCGSATVILHTRILLRKLRHKNNTIKIKFSISSSTVMLHRNIT